MDTVRFAADDGEFIEFLVLEETRVAGTGYLLVADSDDEEATAYILKDLSGDGEDVANYVMVEDDVEFEAIAKIFEQMMEDTSFRRAE